MLESIIMPERLLLRTTLPLWKLPGANKTAQHLYGVPELFLIEKGGFLKSTCPSASVYNSNQDLRVQFACVFAFYFSAVGCIPKMMCPFGSF